MRPTFARCTDCHADDHGGQLKARADRGECSACHRGVRLDAQHLRQRGARAAEARARRPAPAGGVRGLPRDGPEGAAADERDGGGGGQGQLPLRGHRDGLRGVSRRSAPGTIRERRCAGEGRGVPGLPWHARVPALDGGRHRARGVRVPARGRPPGDAPARRVTRSSTEAPPARSSLRLAGTRFADLQFAAKQGCADCHTSPHGTPVRRLEREGRLRGLSFGREPSRRRDRFDHNTDAAFALKGAHESVPCAQCHVRQPGATDSMSVIYAPLSGKCETCHGKESR